MASRLLFVATLDEVNQRRQVQQKAQEDADWYAKVSARQHVV